jgi:hypothetical protein
MNALAKSRRSKSGRAGLCILILVLAGCAGQNSLSDQNWTKEGASFRSYKVLMVRPVAGDNPANASFDPAVLTLKLKGLISEHLKSSSGGTSLTVTTDDTASSGVLIVDCKLVSYSADPPRSTGANVGMVSVLAFATVMGGGASTASALVNGPAKNATVAMETTLTDRQTGQVMARLTASGSASQQSWSQEDDDTNALGSAAVNDALDKTATDVAKLVSTH